MEQIQHPNDYGYQPDKQEIYWRNLGHHTGEKGM